MAEWSQLPKELLDQISTYLETSFDILRFRSVCSTWRSSVLPPHHRHPHRFPILPHDGMSSTFSALGFHLSKRTVLILSSPDNPSGWLIKLEEDVPNRPHLLYPLSGLQLSPLPTTFPKRLDLLKLRVSELCQEYVLQYINYRPFANSIADAGNLYMEKVVFRPNVGIRFNGFTLLTIHISGKLAIYKSGCDDHKNNKWRVVNDMLSPYDDVALYKGGFYAVDSTGRTVNVDADCGKVVEVVNHDHVFDGDKKYLVCSPQWGRLLLVDKHLGLDSEEGGYNENGSGSGDWLGQFTGLWSERVVKFKVYELDENLKKWVKLKSLGDEVLFLGENSTFSASASELPMCKGNCIYFTNSISAYKEESAWYGIGLFDMESGSIETLSDFPGLFWPPPAWITSTLTGVQNHFEELSL